jgi:hypothetical protein
MSLLTNYHTEAELASELKARTGIGSTRQLRVWRAQRKGPPWAYLGKTVIYPDAEFGEWLRSQMQQPLRADIRSERSRRLR